MIPDEFFALAKSVNNWGRWGPDDELAVALDELARAHRSLEKLFA